LSVNAIAVKRAIRQSSVATAGIAQPESQDFLNELKFVNKMTLVSLAL
jgi:hypothetical protein